MPKWGKINPQQVEAAGFQHEFHVLSEMWSENQNDQEFVCEGFDSRTDLLSCLCLYKLATQLRLPTSVSLEHIHICMYSNVQ